MLCRKIPYTGGQTQTDIQCRKTVYRRTETDKYAA